MRIAPPATLVVVLALAGCGGSGDPLHAVRSAASETLKQNAFATVTLDGQRVFAGTHAQVVGRAASVFPQGIAYEAIDLPAAGSAPAQRWFLTFEPRRVYLARVPALRLPAGKSWVAVRSPPPPLDARETAFVAQAQGVNPQLYLDEIVWGSTAATKTGSSVIAHVPYTEYAVTVDLARAHERAAGTMRVAIEQQLRARPRLRISVMVDGPGHVARLRVTPPGADLGTVTMTLTGFGAPIKGTLPDASSVADLGALPAGSPWAAA
jgi:hypothetical protein